MRRYICDRCGKDLPTDEDANVTVEIVRRHFGVNTKQVDLCEECFNVFQTQFDQAFEKFMEGNDIIYMPSLAEVLKR